VTARSGERTDPNRPDRVNSAGLPKGCLPLKSIGVDWLTASCKDASLRGPLEDFMNERLYEERQRGNDVKPWRLMQFEGLAAGPVGYGLSDEMSIVRLSREAARDHWREVLGLTTGCSRIDLQTTISEVPDCQQLIADHEREALTHVASWSKPPEVTLRKSNRTGLTLYLNRRVSDRFARIYDKGVESKEAAWDSCLRYEVQFNNEAGKLMAATLLNDSSQDAGISGRVYRFFLERGCVLPWQPEAMRYNVSVPRSRSDAGRRLRWLAAQVRPSIERLIADGRIQEVYEALGLPANVQLDHGRSREKSTREEK